MREGDARGRQGKVRGRILGRPLAATKREVTVKCDSRRRENGRNVNSFQAWPLWPATLVGYELGGSAPHQCR